MGVHKFPNGAQVPQLSLQQYSPSLQTDGPQNRPQILFVALYSCWRQTSPGFVWIPQLLLQQMYPTTQIDTTNLHTIYRPFRCAKELAQDLPKAILANDFFNFEGRTGAAGPSAGGSTSHSKNVGLVALMFDHRDDPLALLLP
ncbi:hypothetical protein ACA910_021582 [Epithemia clementina (nom. ined.)]